MVKKRTHRKGKRSSRRMRGGQLSGSDLSNTSMNMPSKVNGLQGQEYLSQHANQHGGYQNNMMPTSNTMLPPSNTMMSTSNTMMPNNNLMPRVNMPNQSGGVASYTDFSTGVLDSGLRGAARLDTLDNSFNEIKGMNDQSGGRRRRKSRRGGGRKSRRSNCKTKKGGSRRKSRRSRMRGGSHMNGSPVDSSPMLLPSNMSAGAEKDMNAEWELAKNPNSFSPN